MLYVWLIGIFLVVILVLYFTSSSKRFETKVFDPVEERLRQNDEKNEAP